MTENQDRPLPANDLDLNLMLTDNVWGKNEISVELKEKLTKYYLSQNEKGESTLSSDSLWNIFGMYTRDIRLANLSDWNGEIVYVRYYLDLAHDLLLHNYFKSFMVAMSRAITVLESSQSKNGFLRVKQNTLRQEHINQQIEPPKKGFFGGNRKENNGVY